MDLVFDLKIEKIKGSVDASVNSELTISKEKIRICYSYLFSYIKKEVECVDTYEFEINVNLKNGNIRVEFVKSQNDKWTEIRKTNNFLLISDIVYDGMNRGFRSEAFWGVKLRNYNMKVCEYIKKIFDDQYDDDFHQIPNNYDQIFSDLVHFNMFKKKIKPHNNIFYNIHFDYPTMKNLKLNKGKYVQSVLEKYGLNNSFFVKMINTSTTDIHLQSLKNLTLLFGDNHIDFIRELPTTIYDSETMKSVKIEPLKTNKEKRQLIELIKSMSSKQEVDIVSKIIKLKNLNDFLTQNDLTLKFNKDMSEDYDVTFNVWSEYKKILIKKEENFYQFPESFIDTITKNVVVDGQNFYVSLLKSETDFLKESFKMKNCLSTHFTSGLIYIYLSVFDGEKHYNLQFKKHKLLQVFGKANSKPPKHMDEVCDIISKRMFDCGDVIWTKGYKKLNNEK